MSGCVRFLSSPTLVGAWSQAGLSSSHSVVKSALDQRRERRPDVAAAAPHLSAFPFPITPLPCQPDQLWQTGVLLLSCCSEEENI